MALLDASNAGKIPRTPQGVTPLQKIFGARYPDGAKWWSYMKREIIDAQRHPPANPKKTEIEDFAALTEEIKQMTLDLGATVVGIADYNPDITFTEAEELDHKSVIVFLMPMAFDVMIDIGPKSQEDVHKTYFLLDEAATRLATRISAYGFDARVQANRGEIPLPAYGQLAGLGELGKHGSLISPELGSAFRISAVSTDMPLLADGPRDFGIDEICTNCHICTRFCPGEAIRPQKVSVDGMLRWQIDTPACHPHFLRLYGCKICLSVCPMNARGNKKAEYKTVANDIRAAKDAAGMLQLIDDRGDLKLEEFDEKARKLSPEDREMDWWGVKRPLRTANYGDLCD
ncbi:MAG: 4Fe-4S dicluster domain-containing protein [Rhodospirillales bacterium]|jgi:Pyruvate/2-oxoacid:ferredoxin oxidoreductase delta subunit|nr:4Fe-4S dicluster domain-containing protein [Rhodospirillales bacterium]MDP6644790.1 4Fe-4S dicluster domain-containing protein [Rhodospirillales bacterium]MDP6843083.1 4Fe-4S dicluster domain-containing protein [Rhodospirillales bacterium]